MIHPKDSEGLLELHNLDVKHGKLRLVLKSNYFIKYFDEIIILLETGEEIKFVGRG